MNQIELHKKIDEMITTGPVDGVFEDVKGVIYVNEDSRQYFFTKADERWLNWLWSNGFLNCIKEKAKDENNFSYSLPELQYLVNVAEKDPSGVVDVILQIPISEKTFNPEVVSRFLWICGSLQSDQIARIVSKIRNEKWIQLMKKFNHSGFDYEKMFEELFKARDWKNFLVLSEAVLAIRSKEEIKNDGNKYGSDNPFYFNDLRQIKLFEYLSDIDDENLEDTLTLVMDAVKRIVLMERKENKSQVFEVADSFALYDVDFFTLDFEEERHLSYRDDVKNIAVTMKKLLERILVSKCSDFENARKLYEKYVDSLPFSHAMWRFRLFAMTLCPDIFADKLKDAFFKFFETKNAYELILGAEYMQALKKGFSVLSNEDKRKYIEKTVEYFAKQRKDKKDEFWHKYKGREMLSCIYVELSKEEITNAEKKLGGKIEKEFNPEPSIVSGIGGFVVSKGPITIEDLQKKSIEEIVKNLSSEWTPENLRKMDKERDFMNPLNADGMGMLLKQDISQRFELYLENADLFFNREALDQHYTYSFLQGVYEVLRESKFKEGVNFEKVLVLLEKIIESDRKEKFIDGEKRRERFDAWVAGWRSVFYAMSDVVKEFLGEGKNKTTIDLLAYRERLLEIINYLLSYPQPDEENNYKENGNDPFSVAINSVRGRAFQSLVSFTYRDGEKFSKEEKIKISEDVKEIYSDVLKKENTFAIMFLYGHYLASFYYRDKEWIRTLMPAIFPEEIEKRDLYLASWEGFVAANIYGDMFSEFKGLYKRAIEFDPDNYTKRKYFRELDDGLATHLALAYAHFSDFSIESELFELFWKNQNSKRHEEFISFVGRHTISREGALSFIEKNKIDIEKIKKLWDWTLDNVEDDKVFSGFGFWIDKERNVFSDSKWLADHMARTLKKSKGELNWDYGLIKSLPSLAEEAPNETLIILEAYLLDHCVEKPESFRNSVYVDDFINAFNILYKNDNLKSAVYELINKLVTNGGYRFWKLIDVLDEK